MQGEEHPTVNFPAPREGTSDLQLSFTESAFGLPQLSQSVLKRDGREQPFDTLKIVSAVQRAATEAGGIGVGAATSLGSAVAIYLAKHRDGREGLTVEHVREAVERVLTQMGYERAALAYARRGTVNAGARDPFGAPNTLRSFDAERTNAEQESGLLSLFSADVEDVIATGFDPSSGESFDPEKTSLSLGLLLKREYARTHVFTGASFASHRDADIHIAGMQGVDRLLWVAPSLVRLARYGATSLDGERLAPRPPRDSADLARHIAAETLTLRRCCSTVPRWDAVNTVFAPFVHGSTDGEMRDLAAMLAHELCILGSDELGPMERIFVGLHWDTPACLQGTDAVLPGGEVDAQPYEDYLETSRRFAAALLDAFAHVSKTSANFAPFCLHVPIQPRPFKDSGHAEFIRRAAELARATGAVTFACDTTAPVLPAMDDAFRPREVVAHEISLNLPRVALRSRNLNGLLAELERLVELAAFAHRQKHDFLVRLFELGEVGPLSALKVRRNGVSLADLAGASYRVGVTGLNECVTLMEGKALHESNASVELAEELLRRLREHCARWTTELGIDLLPCSSGDDETAKRLATSDAARFGDAALQTIGGPGDQAGPRYTPGVSTEASCPLSPMERVRIESRLHPYLAGECVTVVPAPGEEVSSESMVEFIEKALVRTSCKGVRFGRLASAG